MVLPAFTSPPGFSGVLKLIQRRLTAGLTHVVTLTLQLGLFWGDSNLSSRRAGDLVCQRQKTCGQALHCKS